MEKLTICIISREYPPQTHTGGIGTYSYVTATGLAKRGHRVHVICATSGSRECLIEDGVVVHRIPIHPFLLKPGRFWYPVRVLIRKLMFEYLEKQAWSYGATLELNNIKEKIDIVEHAETNAEGYYAGKLTNTKRVCRLHIGGFAESTSNLSGSYLSKKKSNSMERTSIATANHITCPSNALADYTSIHHGIDRNKISVFPNPLDEEFTKRDIKAKDSFEYKILFAGRIERRKGIDILLSSFVNIKSRFPQAKLRFVGQDYGYYYDKERDTNLLQELIKKYRLEDSVEFLPRQNRQNLIKQFEWSDIVVIPSLNENYPYVVIEAMSLAKPVIASDCGGIPEIIKDGETGFLFPTGDIKGLTDTLINVLENKEGLYKIGIQGRKFVLNTCTIDAVLPKIEEAYRKAILN